MKNIELVLNSAREMVKEISAPEVFSNKNNIVLLDCRDLEEFNNGHIAGAIFVPRSQLELRIEDVLPDKSKRLVVYCASGLRSLLTARALIELGYTDVLTLVGGIQAWKIEGNPVSIPSNKIGFDRTRYQAQMRLAEISDSGQQRLKSARVLIIGAGGLGSPVALYLAAAGVGVIGIVDDDVVDKSNLQRQILHTTDRIGLKKVDSAFLSLRALNPEVEVIRFSERLTVELAIKLFPQFDIIVDGTDNFSTRYLINRVAKTYDRLCVHGSVFQWQGQVAVFGGQGPCYECLFPIPPSGDLAPNCAEGGVIGAITGMVGSAMACEAIKIICKISSTLSGKIANFDLKSSSYEVFEFYKDPFCPCCSDKNGTQLMIEIPTVAACQLTTT